MLEMVPDLTEAGCKRRDAALGGICTFGKAMLGGGN